MKKYSVRPAAASDIEVVYSLIANQNIRDYGEALMTMNDLQMVMSEPPAAQQWSEGMEVRVLIPDQDEQATFRADEEASEDKGYHDPLDFEALSKRMRTGLERFDPGLWYLACDGDEIAGVALNVHDHQSNTGWVDHLGVWRAWRKRGIGKALLLHSFNEFHERAVRRVKPSIDSKSLAHAPRLYDSVGMAAIQQYHIYKKDLQTN